MIFKTLQGWANFLKKSILSPLHIWVFNKLKGLVYVAIEGFFHYLFLNKDLVLNIQDQNQKEHPSSFKIEALRTFWKFIFFGKNQTYLTICYLEIKLFIPKRSAKIKPRHLGCSSFGIATKKPVKKKASGKIALGKKRLTRKALSKKAYSSEKACCSIFFLISLIHKFR